jgi:hypothetical protein
MNCSLKWILSIEPALHQCSDNNNFTEISEELAFVPVPGVEYVKTIST